MPKYRYIEELKKTSLFQKAKDNESMSLFLPDDLTPKAISRDFLLSVFFNQLIWYVERDYFVELIRKCNDFEEYKKAKVNKLETIYVTISKKYKYVLEGKTNSSFCFLLMKT